MCEDLHLDECMKILENNFPGRKGTILFASVAGSRSFNLALPTSDADLFGKKNHLICSKFFFILT